MKTTNELLQQIQRIDMEKELVDKLLQSIDHVKSNGHLVSSITFNMFAVGGTPPTKHTFAHPRNFTDRIADLVKTNLLTRKDELIVEAEKLIRSQEPDQPVVPADQEHPGGHEPDAIEVREVHHG